MLLLLSSFMRDNVAGGGDSFQGPGGFNRFPMAYIEEDGVDEEGALLMWQVTIDEMEVS